MAVVTTHEARRPVERITTGDDLLDGRARALLLDLLLRQTSPAALEHAVHRAERSLPCWRLPGGSGSVHERLARFLGNGS